MDDQARRPGRAGSAHAVGARKSADAHRAMRQAGLVLIMIGLLDIAWCAVAVVRGESYSSSLNIFALVAGVLVYRGNTGAARFVVMGLSFLLGGFLLMPLVLPVLMPLRLLWLQL